VPHQELLGAAFDLAHTIASKPPLAVAACLGSVTRGLNASIDEGLAIEASYLARMIPTQDMEEGISAWLDRRAPRFTGT
jgi:enoyl-CoA hydratase/carnithine racemase